MLLETPCVVDTGGSALKHMDG